MDVLVLSVINVLSAVRVLGAVNGMPVLFSCLLSLQVMQISYPLLIAVAFQKINTQ